MEGKRQSEAVRKGLSQKKNKLKPDNENPNG